MPADARPLPAGLREPRPLCGSRAPATLSIPFAARVTLGGFLGQRVAVNALRAASSSSISSRSSRGFVKSREKSYFMDWRAHRQMDARGVMLAWAAAGDPSLRERLDHAAGELIRAQEADGYLGTYLPDVRLASITRTPTGTSGPTSRRHPLGSSRITSTPDSPRRWEPRAAPRTSCCAPSARARRASSRPASTLEWRPRACSSPSCSSTARTGDGAYLDFARYIVAAWTNRVDRACSPS